jgi:aspartate-semialdehyde dehydrogenase
VLGATGIVGQRLVSLLADHPWFELHVLIGSDRSAGRAYGEVVHWLGPDPLPGRAARMVVQPATPERFEGRLVFSALDARCARELEPRFAAAGCTVISNASAFRDEPQVPLLVPEVNADHTALLAGGGPRIVTNPNCSTAGLVCALRPLAERFGVEAVAVVTLQAISGAGHPGISALDILGNVVPFIDGEEDKLEREPRKILGRLEDHRVLPADLAISAQVHRVPVVDGHLLAVSARLSEEVPLEDVRRAWLEFGNPLGALDLPLAPRRLLHVHDQPDAPQPRLHAGLERGMAVSIGRLRRCPVLGVRFVVLVHNTMRGAAGGAVLNAELLARQGLLAAA